jgi:ribosomal protein L34E
LWDVRDRDVAQKPTGMYRSDASVRRSHKRIPGGRAVEGFER